MNALVSSRLINLLDIGAAWLGEARPGKAMQSKVNAPISGRSIDPLDIGGAMPGGAWQGN